MPLHGGEPEGRRVGKVYDLVGPSPSHSRSSLLFPVTLCLSRAYPLATVSRSLFPCPYLSPEPVAHKLIRSRCLLARGLPLATVVTPLALFASSLPSPPRTLRDQDHPFSRSPKVPNIRESYVTERSSTSKSSVGRIAGREGRKRPFNESLGRSSGIHFRDSVNLRRFPERAPSIEGARGN